MAFAATVYVARTLGATHYGVIGFAAAVTLYLARLADFGFDVGLGVREIAVNPRTTDSLAPAVLTFRFLLGATLAVLVGIVGAVWLPEPDGTVLAVYGLTLLAVGLGGRWIHLGLERARHVALARTLGELAMALAVVGLVRGPHDLARVPLAQFLGDACAAFLLLWWLRRAGHALPVRAAWNVVRPLLPRAWPLVGSGLLGLVIYNADLIVLRLFHGTTAAGYYAAAYALISFLINLGTAYSLSLLPTLSRLGGGTARQEALYHTAAAQVFAVACPLAVGGLLLAPQIVGTVFGTAYGPSGAVLGVLMCSVPFLLLRGVPQVGLMARQREDRVLRATGWAAATNLALNLALIPPYGMTGAALATLGTEVTRLALTAGLARATGFPFTSPVRFWRATVATAAMAGALLVARPPTLWLGLGLGVMTYGVALVLAGGLRLRHRGWPVLDV